MPLLKRKSQKQSSGAGSQQNQASGDMSITNNIVQVAQYVLLDQKANALAGFTAAAMHTGDARVAQFNERTLSQFPEDRLQAFSEPDFQVLLRQAQIAAACSGDESDYDLLIQLLSERADDDRRAARSSISKAIEVIDKVETRALHGLSTYVHFYILNLSLPTIGENLDRLNETIKNINIDDLPTGPRWLEHLDTLGLVRVIYDGRSSLKTYEQILTEMMAGYLGPGLSHDAAAEFNAELTGRGFDTFQFYPHDFNAEAVRLSYPNVHHLEAAIRTHGHSEEEIVEIRNLAAERAQFGVVDASYRVRMMAESDQRPALLRFKSWRDSIEPAFQVTELGRLLVLANLQRLFPTSNVPRFDFSI